MANSALISPDWVYSNSSNVSVAKDRAWFTSYTPFTSYLGHLAFPNGHQAVVGIGSIEIPVKLRHNRKGKKHNIIRIDNVLHAPTATCNILGGKDFDDRYNFTLGSGESIKDSKGRAAGYFDEAKELFCLKLSGPPVGPVTGRSLFLKSDNPDDLYYINAQWPASERTRWQSSQVQKETSNSYTDAEKAWLKKHYRDEYHFLQQHSLSIYKDEDREEGRAIVRAFMTADDDSEGDDDSDRNSFLDELESDPMSHVADINFSERQLDWIKSHYTHSGNFLQCHGLRPFDDEDCSEGKAILEQMMD